MNETSARTSSVTIIDIPIFHNDDFFSSSNNDDDYLLSNIEDLLEDDEDDINIWTTKKSTDATELSTKQIFAIPPVHRYAPTCTSTEGGAGLDGGVWSATALFSCETSMKKEQQRTALFKSNSDNLHTGNNDNKNIQQQEQQQQYEQEEAFKIYSPLWTIKEKETKKSSNKNSNKLGKSKSKQYVVKNSNNHKRSNTKGDQPPTSVVIFISNKNNEYNCDDVSVLYDDPDIDDDDCLPPATIDVLFRFLEDIEDDFYELNGDDTDDDTDDETETTVTDDDDSFSSAFFAGDRIDD